jgi:hypothetical protein
VTLLPVWFLAHPVAGDEKYSYTDNMGIKVTGITEDEVASIESGHVIKVLKLCYAAGFAAVAPYYELCLALDDNNPNDRTAGMLTGTTLIKGLGRLILSGHKLSRGMEQEVAACLDVGGSYLNLIGVPDRDFVAALKTAQPVRHLNMVK